MIEDKIAKGIHMFVIALSAYFLFAAVLPLWTLLGTTDGVIGIGIAATAVGVIAGGIALLTRKK